MQLVAISCRPYTYLLLLIFHCALHPKNWPTLSLTKIQPKKDLFDSNISKSFEVVETVVLLQAYGKACFWFDYECLSIHLPGEKVSYRVSLMVYFHSWLIFPSSFGLQSFSNLFLTTWRKLCTSRTLVVWMVYYVIGGS